MAEERIIVGASGLPVLAECLKLFGELELLKLWRPCGGRARRGQYG